MDQSDLDKAVRIATASAMRGRPIKRLIYIPPYTASQVSGVFVVEYCTLNYTAADTPDWER